MAAPWIGWGLAEELLLFLPMVPDRNSNTAQPPKIKRSGPASGFKRLLIGILFIGPVLWLGWLWMSGARIHAGHAWLNLVVHAWLILVPLAWAVVLTCKPLQFEEMDEIPLGTNHYFSAWRVNWWVSLLLWAPALFALVALAVDCCTVFVRQPGVLITSPLTAAVRLILVTAMGSFYGVVLFERVEPRVSVFGIRAGLTHFHEWEKVEHVSKREDVYSIYHRIRPGLPAVSIRVSSPESAAILDQFLSRFQIPVSAAGPAGATGLGQVKAGVVTGFLLVLGVGYTLRYQLGVSLSWSVFITFLMGLLLGSALERIRGVHHYTKHRPRLR